MIKTYNPIEQCQFTQCYLNFWKLNMVFYLAFNLPASASVVSLNLVNCFSFNLSKNQKHETWRLKIYIIYCFSYCTLHRFRYKFANIQSNYKILYCFNLAVCRFYVTCLFRIVQTDQDVYTASLTAFGSMLLVLLKSDCEIIYFLDWVLFASNEYIMQSTWITFNTGTTVAFCRKQLSKTANQRLYLPDLLRYEAILTDDLQLQGTQSLCTSLLPL